MTDYEAEDGFPWDDPNFKVGLQLGSDLGRISGREEAIQAYDAGEIDLFVGYNRPKTLEDWKKWKAEHGDHDKYTDRWKRPDPE